MENATIKKELIYWQSLEEKNNPKALNDKPSDEFDLESFFETKASSKFGRRDFLKLMGFGLGAALVSCSKMPIEKAIPYLVQPENIIPGKSYWYASTCAGCPSACGIIVKNRDGRPIKIEGNNLSPLNRGGLCATGQASVLELYDSSRLQHPLINGTKASWDELDTGIVKEIKNIQAKRGRVAFVSHTIPSPTQKKNIQKFLESFPKADHIVYDPIPYDGILNAHERAFGTRVIPHFNFEEAEIILSFGADFLGTWLSPVEFSKQYVQKRRVSEENPSMSRHYQFESRLSLTGANADYRIPLSTSRFGETLITLIDSIEGRIQSDEKLIETIAQELKVNKGKSIVISDSPDENVQLLMAYLNYILGNYGSTLTLDHPSLQRQGNSKILKSFVEKVEKNYYDAVFIYGANPVYDTGYGKRLEAAFQKSNIIFLSERLDETTRLAKYVAPLNHFLESWNDAEPIRGLFHLSQPLIQPLFDTRSFNEILARWQGKQESALQTVQEFWKKNIYSRQKVSESFEAFWNRSVHDGYYDTRLPNTKQFKFLIAIDEIRKKMISKKEPLDRLELQLYESVALRDGRAANNPWLHELPDPISKITWDNYANISPSDAKHFGVENGDVIEIAHDDLSIKIPAYIQPGQAKGTIAIALGYGRRSVGKVGNNLGVDVYPFLGHAYGNYFLENVVLKKTGKSVEFAMTQTHSELLGRPIVKETTLENFRKDPQSGNHDTPDLHMLWQSHTKDIYSWGLAIALNACTGCSSCIISCQAENNIPTVGRDEVRRRREMHWMRLDRYYKGHEDNPEVVFQPMFCQHCGNAPCESVCPVLATVHSSDGLNQQVYNRCVGTRYCANNCPYKVRRFNWFDYARNQKFDYSMNDDIGRLVLNPDVVVRPRGVMEKCSLCIQRIQEKKLAAKEAGTKLNSDDIKLACQQSCPTDAIVFGDLNDLESKLSRLLKNTKRGYHVLAEINTRPAVCYLVKVRNKA